MNDFDRELKEMSKDMMPPDSYQQRVDDVLKSLPEENPYSSKKVRNRHGILKMAVCAVCVLLVLFLAFSPIKVVNANIFTDFKQTLMEFFHIGQDEASEDYGVDSEPDQAVSKPDLFMELKEKIVDKHSIYALVSITAPTDIVFDEQIGFEYFAFCEGSSYNADNILGGGKECSLLEVQEGKEHMATYVVSIATDQKIPKNKDITLCCRNLMRDPFGDAPEMLVEGMWSITFRANYTVSENIKIKGTKDMTFSHDGGTVTLTKIDLTPLGISVSADVTELHYADNAYSDETSLPVTLRMVDGSEIVIISHDPAETGYISMGSDSFKRPKGREILTSRYEFEKMIDISKVIGIYIEDLYVPVLGE